MNKKENPRLNLSAETNIPSQELPGLGARNHVTVGRRSFLRGLGIVGATLLPASAILLREAKAQEQSSRKLTKGDADLLRFAAWAEIVESDLWVQYNELGGATKPNDGSSNAGNPPYKLALQNLDGDMPQYITDNTDDELSHAAFLNAYLKTHGAEPVDLDQFRTLLGSTATGVDKTKVGKRLTNLLNLNVDLSWYTRYRSEENPDLGAIFKGPINILNEPGIPLTTPIPLPQSRCHRRQSPQEPNASKRSLTPRDFTSRSLSRVARVFIRRSH